MVRRLWLCCNHRRVAAGPGARAAGVAAPCRSALWLSRLGSPRSRPSTSSRALNRHDFALTAQSRREFRHSWNPAYQAADEDLDVLRRTEVLPGPFFVFGDPILLLRANRAQAISVPGMGPRLVPGQQGMAGARLRIALRGASLHRRRQLQRAVRPEPVLPASMERIESNGEVAFVGASGQMCNLRPTRN